MNRLAIRRVVVDGRSTSIRLGSAMWEALKYIACGIGFSVHALVIEIDQMRENPRLDAAIRNYVMGYYRAKCRERSAAT